jgi:hypothetical protein
MVVETATRGDGMKRIGILTFCRNCNYGSALQAFALARKIAEDGHCAEIVNFQITPVPIWRRHVKGVVRRLLQADWKTLLVLSCRYVGARASKPAGTPDIWQMRNQQRRERFATFWEEMPFSSDAFDAEQIKFNPPAYDAFIAGSDQVWNYRLSQNVDIFLLSFVKSSARRIAYAASLGVRRIPLHLRRLYRQGIERFHHLSMRETAGIRVIEKLTHRKVQHVVDPTLLMTADEWRRESVPVEAPASYVLLYSLSASKTILGHAYRLAGELGVPLVTICPRYDEEEYPGTLIRDGVGPREFLTLLAGARLLVTDSFHGTVFALNFGVNFLVIAYSHWEYNNRIEGLCAEYGLQDHYYEDRGTQPTMPPEIDYDRVHALLAEKRVQSLAWLRRSLEN